MPDPNYKPASAYEPVPTVPDGLKWRPQIGKPNKTYVKLVSTPGAYYRLERSRETGEVRYFKLKDTGPEMSPKEKIDTEPTRKDVRYRVGTKCWFVDVGEKWFLVEVTDRTPRGQGHDPRITIKPCEPLDADKRAAWPHGELLEFPASPDSQLFTRLRPLKDRYR